MDELKLRKALLAEGVHIPEEQLKRVIRRLFNPAGCELCGARTKVSTERADGSLRTVCCGAVTSPAPRKEKK